MSVDARAMMQEQQYAFPYHYLTSWSPETLTRTRSLKWGLEQACYLQYVVDVIGRLDATSVLDVGCGDGRLLGHLSSVPRRVGVDLSPRAIAFARAFHPEVEYSTQDVSEIDELFEVVTLIEVLEHIPDSSITDFLMAAADRVAPGGHLIITVPSTAQPVHEKHYRHYDEGLLRGQLAGASIPHTMRMLEHVCPNSGFLRLYERITINRLWTVVVNPIENWVWRRVMRQRVTDPGRGRHLLAVVQVNHNG